MKRFLIIRFSSIGDVVLTTPVVRIIKKQIPDSHITFVVRQKFVDVIASNPYINKVYVMKSNLQDVIQELKSNHFDYVIDLHNNFRSRRIRKAVKKTAFIVNKLNIQKWLYVNFKINRLPDVHVVDRYLETLKSFNVVNDNEWLDFTIPPQNNIDLSFLPSAFTEGFVAFVIGARHNTKRLPNNKIVEICQKLNKPVILLGGKEDTNDASIIEQSYRGNIYNSCGLYNIYESASIIKQSRLVITNDTGLMHIAAALQKNIISVWGNTVPEFGMYPYMPRNKYSIIEVSKLRCRPCSKLGFKSCPKNHFRCMNWINVDDIVEKANEMWNQ